MITRYEKIRTPAVTADDLVDEFKQVSEMLRFASEDVQKSKTYDGLLFHPLIFTEKVRKLVPLATEKLQIIFLQKMLI